MKLALLLAAALLAGCAAPAAPQSTPDADATDASFSPYHAEGAFWVEPSQGPEPTKVEIPFLVNATGRATTASVTIGERYGPLDLPTSTAGMEVQLLDAAGEVVDEATRGPGDEETLTLEGADLPVGEGKLVILLRGGSDGGANGDHVSYVLDVQ